MSAKRREMHFGVFVLGTGNHSAGWRYEGAATGGRPLGGDHHRVRGRPDHRLGTACGREDLGLRPRRPRRLTAPAESPTPVEG
jgi:hypothetical protein